MFPRWASVLSVLVGLIAAATITRFQFQDVRDGFEPAVLSPCRDLKRDAVACAMKQQQLRKWTIQSRDATTNDRQIKAEVLVIGIGLIVTILVATKK